jgi:hypothetical protein
MLEKSTPQKQESVRLEESKMHFYIFFMPTMIQAPSSHRFENVHLAPTVRREECLNVKQLQRQVGCHIEPQEF